MLTDGLTAYYSLEERFDEGFHAENATPPHGGTLLARFWDPHARARIQRSARVMSERIVAHEWPRITGLALALMNWRSMSGELVLKLLPAFGPATVSIEGAGATNL